MKILFIGDIFGDVGITAIEQELKIIKKKYDIDFTIANAENTSKARGLYLKDYLKLIDAGIDFFTMGNHTWHKKEIENILNDNENIIRPYNLEPNQSVSNWGVGTRLININNKRIRISNLIGQSVMFSFNQTNPFLAMDEILLNQDWDIHIVDFHSETTSEKNAFLLNFSGKVSAILGTHTHVQTNDAKIFNNTAYISDVGMTGPSNGVIGAKPETIIEKFRGESDFFRLEEQMGKYQLSAVVIEFDDKTNKPMSIENFIIYQI